MLNPIHPTRSATPRTSKITPKIDACLSTLPLLSHPSFLKLRYLSLNWRLASRSDQRWVWARSVVTANIYLCFQSQKEVKFSSDAGNLPRIFLPDPSPWTLLRNWALFLIRSILSLSGKRPPSLFLVDRYRVAKIMLYNY